MASTDYTKPGQRQRSDIFLISQSALQSTAMKAKPGPIAVLARMATQAVAGVLVLGLLLPFLGPVIDHHFAERFPHHGHIYVASPDTEHIHAYALPHHHHANGHSHVHGGLLPVAADTALIDTAPLPDMLFFVSNDGLTRAPMTIVVPPVRLDVPVPLLHDRGYSLPTPADDTLLAGVAVAPADEPPRV